MTGRGRRSGVEDRWHKTIRHPDGTSETVPTVRNGTGLRWMARWVDAEGREQSKSFARKLDATEHLKTVITAQATGTYVDPRLGKVTFASFYAEWSKRQVWVANTYRAMGQAVTSVHFSDRPLSELRTSDIQTWVKTMEKTLAATTIRTRFANVRTVIRAAVKDQTMARDITQGVSLPRLRRAEAAMVIPTSEEVGRLITGTDWLPTLVAVAAFTGLRKGELSALKVSDVNFLRKEVTVARQVQFNDDGTMEIRAPKRESERVVYAPEQLMTMISEYLRVHNAGDDPDRWLFPGIVDRTKPVHAAAVGRAWRAARVVANVEFTLHDLRHFYASGLIASGCDVVTVQRALGHADATMTLSTYSHLWPDASDRTRNASSDMMRVALASAPADWLRTGGPK